MRAYIKMRCVALGQMDIVHVSGMITLVPGLSVQNFFCVIGRSTLVPAACSDTFYSNTVQVVNNLACRHSAKAPMLIAYALEAEAFFYSFGANTHGPVAYFVQM